jgi:4,5-DOPA dioxygenase extradiol
MMKEFEERMPALFIGHGSPMIAIEKSIYSDGIMSVAKALPLPKAILCISAHWETRGTYVTAMEKPKTIHDFGGFPRELYKVQYPAPGNPELAKKIQKLIQSTDVGLNNDWGLDHGCWSVVKYLYPKADIPIVELSIDYTKSMSFHYALGKELSELRKAGVLIVASGNIIHNLRMIDWNNLNVPNTGYDWANKVHREIVAKIKANDIQSLIDYDKMGREYRLSIPAPDHFIPLLYILGMQDKNDKTAFFNDSLVGGSLDMTSLILS